jgi:DNA repair exonuclease SbcCD ATPase subunit
MVNLQEMKNIIEQKKGRLALLEEQLAKCQGEKEASSTMLDRTQKARALVQFVAQETQKKIEYQISGLATMALASVFPDPYEVQLRFVERRNATEADIVFIKDGNETDDILNAGGGGVADVASFALRVALWSIKKTRSTFLLDEPFKFVSIGLQDKCSAMIKNLSEKLKIQIIMVSHLPEIIQSADKIISIIAEEGRSSIDKIE